MPRRYQTCRTIFRKYPDVVSVEQMCKMLGGISKKTGYRLLKGNIIHSFVIGRMYKIPKLRIRSEVVGLQWSAIDFRKNTFTIRHTVTEFVMEGKRVIAARDSTKTKSSYRTLPMIEPLHTSAL